MACITPCVKDGLLHCLEDGWQCGIRVESNTGLYTFGQRYYDTDLGRWTQMDPVGGTVGNPNSGNPYVYANDEPNMLVDPTGRDTNPSAIATCLAAAAGAVVLLVLATATGPGGIAALFLLSTVDYEAAAVVGCFTAIVGILTLQFFQYIGL